MQAVVVANPGRDAELMIQDVADPVGGPEDVVINVSHTAVNRADLLQARGLYPPPKGASDYLGLECAGTIEAVGSEVSTWHPGQRVMALLSGGGYAQRAVAHQSCVMPVPDAVTMEQAAAVPETFLTAYLNIFLLAGAAPGCRVLVHGGGSGVGTAAISLCREASIPIYVTAGSDEKCQRCLDLGAHTAINYRRESFADAILAQTNGVGMDIVLDCVGGPYLADNLRLLSQDGRLVSIGLMGGSRAELDLGAVLKKRIQIIGSTLRSLPIPRKAELVSSFRTQFSEALERGQLEPIIHAVMPWTKAKEAHDVLKASQHFGKIVLAVPPPP